MTVDEACNSSEWSREQNKAFENALVTYAEDSTDRWEKIAADVPGKTLEDIKQHYELLEDDVNRNESGCVPLLDYNSYEGSTCHGDDEETTKKGSGHLRQYNGESNHGSKNSRSDQERRKGIAWTEDEHRLFLLGLEKYGKGDWRSISRNFVVTRTPTQVASQAQKYFIRLNSMNKKDRKRSSIHDITNFGNVDIPATQGPITGQSNSAAAGGSSAKQPPQHHATPPSVGMYSSPTIGQPIGAPFVSTIGTPVYLPAPTHVASGVRAPAPGELVSGTPMNTVL